MATTTPVALSKEEALKLIEDSGNIRLLEHINLSNVEKCTEQAPVNIFYMHGLGCARDPRLSYHFWANFGRNQFHLFTSQKQNECFSGSVYLYVPDLDALEQRLSNVAEQLAHTKFAFERVNRGGATTVDYPREQWQTLFDAAQYDHIVAHDPYGNEIRCFVTPAQYWAYTEQLGGLLPADSQGKTAEPQGMPFVLYPVRPGIAQGIARFYEEYLGAKTVVTPLPNASPEDTTVLYRTHVLCGPLQAIVFEERESERDNKGEYDGHHLCLYMDRFEELYNKAFNDQMQWNNVLFFDRCDTWKEASRDQQYRILHIIDPKDRSFLMTLEHEIRSAQHFRNTLLRRDITPEEEAENEAKRQKNL
ncbi:TPA: hypothetical protein N0F65_008285 [Lagenidium giganteum]|uniref:Uncharacterized protein n=1 Tax=Lagenidium giganteum TaxID=4803 RepID=A0AAV2YWA1_9STRA|nr:TPA: hypothetical protein N0F65_008285 [Lagenidium giganteum]